MIYNFTISTIVYFLNFFISFGCVAITVYQFFRLTENESEDVDSLELASDLQQLQSMRFYDPSDLYSHSRILLVFVSCWSCVILLHIRFALFIHLYCRYLSQLCLVFPFMSSNWCPLGTTTRVYILTSPPFARSKYALFINIESLGEQKASKETHYSYWRSNCVDDYCFHPDCLLCRSYGCIIYHRQTQTIYHPLLILLCSSFFLCFVDSHYEKQNNIWNHHLMIITCRIHKGVSTW